ncbi:MAG TPA: M3 family metallopeptidase [Candidatus Limnocylindrales bacterium]|nr:M3 family metallopeptidase [Candidatus Limnocylindrales bacterium]
MSTASDRLAFADDLARRGADGIEAARGRLAGIERAGPPFGAESVLEPLNDLQLALTNVATECGLLSEVHPDLAVREAAEAQVRDVVAFNTSLLQNEALYRALTTIPAETLDPPARRAVDLLRRDMRRAGIELDGSGRERVRALRDELVEIEQEFSRNIRDDVGQVSVPADALDGLPEDFARAHPPGPDGRVRITTDYPDYIPFMSYSRSGPARRELLRASHTRAVPRNLEVLSTMLEKRHELARLLGYAHWADYATEDKMLGTAGAAWEFVARAYEATRESGAAERAQLLARKRSDDPAADSIADWELSFYTERVKAEQLSFDARAVRPYFEYRSVRQAILDLNSELFGLTITPLDEAAWHPSVETFAIAIDGEPMGRISLDMHPREGKFKHAACFPYRVGVGGRQQPHYVLVCNFPDPAAQSGPALMDHREVVTFFHEFGHLIHGIARGKVHWLRVAGVTERDFVEAPSQFLEEWIYDLEVLRRFARHVETGEPIPEELVRRLRDARDFGRGVQVQRQLFFSAISLAYHDRDPAGLDTTALLFELADEYSPTELHPDSRFQASFGHLEGYSAVYATYMWSLVIAKDLHTAFANGLMDTVQARRYRDLILAPGGTKHAADLIRDFLGRPFDFEAFRRWLAPAPPARS